MNPHQPIPVVYYDPFLKRRALRLMHWNLIPSRLATRADVDSFDSTYSTFNARIESVATAPTFSDCWRSQRCLIVVDGIIEWVGGRRYKTPHLIRRKDSAPFAMAGLWSRWRGKDSDEVWSCTVIVRDADHWYTKFHDRMAIMLPNESHDDWIDPARTTGQLEIIERAPYRKQEELDFYPISRLVNNPRNDSPECLEQGEIYEDPQSDLFAQA